MEITTVGIDLAKNLYPGRTVYERSRVVLRKKLHREYVVEVFAGSFGPNAERRHVPWTR